MNKVTIDYEDFVFLMNTMVDVMSEYSGSKYVTEEMEPKYNKLSVLLAEKDIHWTNE